MPMDALNQFAEFPVWALALVAILVIVVIITRGTALVFAVCYAFFWGKTRLWFNRKAGSDFMPAKRIERPQSIAAAIGVVLLVVHAIADQIPTGEGVSVTKMLLTNLSTLVILAFLFYTVKRYRDRSQIVGAQQARWEALYLFLSCMTIFAVAAMAIALFIMLLAVIFLMDKGFDFTHKNLHAGATSDGTPASSGMNFSCDHIRMLDGHCYKYGRKCDILKGGSCMDKNS